LHSFLFRLRLQMNFTVITPSYQSAPYVSRCIRSVLRQREEGVNVEYLFIDGGSTDGTMEILAEYAGEIDHVVSEPDNGPAHAINKGFSIASGDVISWLNADDEYTPGALARVAEIMKNHSENPFCFGHCPIIDDTGTEIRKTVTRVKKACYPVSSRFVFQCINYISQPAMFFRKEALEKAGPLRLDLKAAWDYEFLLRLWRQGRGLPVSCPPLARFRWTSGSISGQNFRRQFEEEFQAAKEDAGAFSPQTFLHFGVKWGIIGMYSLMSRFSGPGQP
jgi:glycosyltransferase involved in cell wall biosynthesis